MVRVSALALCLCIPLSSPVNATEVNSMPSLKYDEMGAKLMMLGYRDLRVIDEPGGIIDAYDSEGSEVTISVNIETRQILSITYVRDADL